MPLNPLTAVIFLLFIAVGIYIRFKRHPKFPVITIFLMVGLLAVILAMFAVDYTLSPPSSVSDSFVLPGIIMDILIRDYKTAPVDRLYAAFEQLKTLIVLMIIASHISLFVETGIILKHKRDRSEHV